MKRSSRVIASLCLVGYVSYVFYRTVFRRACKDEFRYNLHPFWSYSAIMDGRTNLIREHYLNVALFIPLGFLLWFVLRKKQWWMALVFGCSISVCIETMQLLMKRGFFEFDDVIHNTLGCMIGYAMACGVRRVIQGLNKKNNII